jgi:hypothetical protein
MLSPANAVTGKMPMLGTSLYQPRHKKNQSPGLFRAPHLTDLLGVEAQGVEKHGVVEGCSAIREHPFKEHNVAEGIAERRSCGCVERFQRFEEAVHARYASERGH